MSNPYRTYSDDRWMVVVSNSLATIRHKRTNRSGTYTLLGHCISGDYHVGEGLAIRLIDRTLGKVS